MARVRKLHKPRDGDAILSVQSNKYYEGGELFVVPGGKRAYMATHYMGNCVAFSGSKTLKAIADAIYKALKTKK